MISFKAFNLASIIESINKTRNRFKPEAKIPSDAERSIAQLPEGGIKVSVELALNSRCTSDYDDDPNLFHWGMFDRYQKLSDEHLTVVENMLNIPRFTSINVCARRNKNIFTFLIPVQASNAEKEWVMVESGMQQQALALICSSLGVGVIFRNLGINGRELSETEIGTIQMKLDAMKPSYEGLYWTPSRPAGRRTWLQGRLPQPLRNGPCALLDTLNSLKTENSGAEITDEREIGQLLWAGRGRTPHCYKSREWGMTVPTWGGRQDLTDLFLCLSGNIYRYVNWMDKKPTHDLAKSGAVNAHLSGFLKTCFPQYSVFIILCKNETSSRSLWEIGYQILNILLQAKAWDLQYKSVLISDEQKDHFVNSPMKEPVALVAVKSMWEFS